MSRSSKPSEQPELTPLARSGSLGSPISRRSMLTGSIGAPALIASPDLFSIARARAAATPANDVHSAFFMYGVPGPAPRPGASIRAARPPTLRAPARVSLRPVATQLARLPVISPDQTTLALVSVDAPAARTTVTLSLVDTASMAVVSGGILTMRDLPAGTLVLVTPVFAAGSTTVAVVLSITIPTNMLTVSK